jgi:riboflavin synthase
MFTGIVEEVGRVERIETREGLTRLVINAETVTSDLGIGDSVAVNGACLTVVERAGSAFAVEATPETLRRTNLGALLEGSGVHLERALPANGRVGGHFVQGHVDGVGRLAALRPEGDSVIATFSAPTEVLRYVVPKGSIAVDGVSLTVVDVTGDGFTVALIPHTLDVTLLTRRGLDTPVNLEADILAKYVAKATVYGRDPGLRPPLP